MLAVLAFVSLVLVYLWLRRPTRPALYPPGPPTFLIFGNLWTAIEMARGNYVEAVINAGRKQFGDVIGFVFPNGMKFVHLFKFEDIREACGKMDLTGRSPTFPALVRSHQKRLGIILGEGTPWMEHRRFALRHLRDLGFGKISMEAIVLEEFEHLASDLKSRMGSPMKANFRFELTLLNILWKLIADLRLDRSDPEAQHYVDSAQDFFRSVGPKSPLNFAPWLRFVLPEWTGYNALVRHRETTVAVFSRLMREHQQSLDPHSPRDYIDHFLIEMQQPDAAERHYTEANLAVIGMDFFIAGMETTATSLTWALLFMVMHRDVQQRVQSEIDAVLGRRPPAYADRADMPYTEATVLELMRRSSVLPQAIGHRALRDTTLLGYRIPKDTMVMMHLAEVHMDREYWGDPEAFRPERFLTAAGAVRRDERLVPFGVGRRACLGETLARMELFVLFTCLLQRFTFAAAPGQTLTMQPVFAVVQHPMEFFVQVNARG